VVTVGRFVRRYLLTVLIAAESFRSGESGGGGGKSNPRPVAWTPQGLCPLRRPAREAVRSPQRRGGVVVRPLASAEPADIFSFRSRRPTSPRCTSVAGRELGNCHAVQRIPDVPRCIRFLWDQKRALRRPSLTGPVDPSYTHQKTGVSLQMRPEYLGDQEYEIPDRNAMIVYFSPSNSKRVLP